jgi:predicted TIM-barrel fold metal-dependent hydrolase
MSASQSQGGSPPCPGPDPQPHGPRSFAVPPGAVDTHAHVIGLPPDYPLVDGRSYTPPAATPEAYLHMLDATGMSHGVLVQVSVHGIDNRLMLQTLKSQPKRLRGIAVMPLGLPERAYEEARSAGVVGLRLNVLYGGGIGFDTLEDYGALAKEMGWHLQFLVDARDLPRLAPRIERLPVPFVVDHMGHFPTAEIAPHDADFQTLVSLVRDGGWVKLSGAYRLSGAEPPYADTVAYAQRLIEVAPDRCVWGSDWPHVAHWRTMPNVGDLLDTLALWAPNEQQRHNILVTNPARLYRFAAT